MIVKIARIGHIATVVISEDGVEISVYAQVGDVSQIKIDGIADSLAIKIFSKAVTVMKNLTGSNSYYMKEWELKFWDKSTNKTLTSNLKATEISIEQSTLDSAFKLSGIKG